MSQFTFSKTWARTKLFVNLRVYLSLCKISHSQPLLCLYLFYYKLIVSFILFHFPFFLFSFFFVFSSKVQCFYSSFHFIYTIIVTYFCYEFVALLCSYRRNVMSVHLYELYLSKIISFQNSNKREKKLVQIEISVLIMLFFISLASSLFYTS